MTKLGHVFMPQAYKDAQAEMRRQMRLQWPGEPLEGPIAVRVIMFGEARLDADNGAGAALDCGNDLIWKDDRVSVVPVVLAEWHKAPKKDSRWLIQIACL
jgi:Holliday junction resolvase RusA-like endonuclease